MRHSTPDASLVDSNAGVCSSVKETLTGIAGEKNFALRLMQNAIQVLDCRERNARIRQH
jgi:hypothetical protein